MRDALNKVDEMKKAKTEVIDISSQPNFSRVSPILYAVHKQKKNQLEQHQPITRHWM